MTVYIHRPMIERWCVLAAAYPGGRVTMACGEWIAYAPVLIATKIGPEFECTACQAALRGGR